MSGVDGYSGSLPKEVAEHVNFLSGMIIVVLAFLLKRIGLLRAEHTPGLQAAAFTFCLPSVLLGILWRVYIDSSVLPVLGIAAATYSVCISVAQVIVRFVPESDKGIYSLALVSHSMAYLYPVLMSSNRFGMDAFPIVAMWELGGSIWASNIYYAMAANVYRVPEAQDNEDALARKPMRRAPSIGTALTLAERAGAASTQKPSAECEDMSIDAIVMPVLHKNSDDPSQCANVVTHEDIKTDVGQGGVRARSDGAHVDPRTVGKASMDETASDVSPTPPRPVAQLRLYSLLLPVLRNPVIWAAVLGLTFNICQVPYYVLPGKAIDSLMGAFSPMLFALLGANLKFNLGREGYVRVFVLLIVRSLLSLAVLVVLRFCVPLPDMQRSVLSLAMLTPIPGTFVMFSFANGFKMDEVVMAYNLSAIISLTALNLLAEVI